MCLPSNSTLTEGCRRHPTPAGELALLNFSGPTSLSELCIGTLECYRLTLHWDHCYGCIETTPSHSPLSSTPSTPPPEIFPLHELTPAVRRNFTAIRGFVEEAVELALNRTQGTLTKGQKFMHVRMDARMPFRELAPSRAAIMAAVPSPFSSALSRTPEGLYSAVIFRGITFNTNFVRDAHHRPLFHNYSEFDAEIQRARTAYQQTRRELPPKSYFCNMNAYGSCITGRKVKLAELYAESIFEDGEELVDLLAQDARETALWTPEVVKFTGFFHPKWTRISRLN
ncbi:hypothetical protein FB45DRAFT_869145 [Roridomyces roridus]|uniref:Uncharacterized protein n=1 Tax=Roridomyces roridus TaxID=1738132 RepID=A0AAD7BNC3_9AGAR|nr:hypothetical protein FB45DRAFT_869145 [Roridomyces roridus]